MFSQLNTGGRARLALLAAVILALAVLPGVALAQGGTVTYGSVVTGSLTAQAPFAIYGFNGNAGDLVSIHVMGMTPEMQPSISLLGPDQRQVALSDDDPFRVQGSSFARISQRLTTTGTYSLIISNLNSTPGDFSLYLQGAAAASPLALIPGTPQTAALAPDAAPVVYVFTPDAAAQTVLTLGTETPNFAFVGQVYDGMGRFIAALTGQSLRVARLVIAPDSGEYTVVLRSAAGAAGNVTAALGIGEAAAPAATATDSPPPATAEPNVCQATSTLNVNVRLGPSTDYEIIGSLFSGTALEVIGRNADRTWFVVNYNGRQGWVASSVVTLEGPCGNLAELQAPPLPPTATPTITPSATPVPSSQVSFLVNGAQTATVPAGGCATVTWDTANVREVYYEGAGVAGTGSSEECPAATTTYTLRVVLNDGTSQNYTVTINVTVAGQPDLYVSEFSLDPATPIQGQPVEVRIGVYNGGTAAVPSTAHRVQWYPGENYGSPACEWELGSLAANGGRILTCTYAGYPSFYPSINTLVRVDANNTISESDESNNEYRQAITVNAP